jgi:hypothetical protein
MGAGGPGPSGQGSPGPRELADPRAPAVRRGPDVRSCDLIRGSARPSGGHALPRVYPADQPPAGSAFTPVPTLARWLVTQMPGG